MATTKKTITKKAETVKSVESLQKDLATKQQDQIDAIRSHRAGELINPRVLTNTRREIARLHTAIRAAQLKEQKEAK